MRNSLKMTTAIVASIHLAVPFQALAQTENAEGNGALEAQLMQECADISVAECASMMGLSEEEVRTRLGGAETAPAEAEGAPADAQASEAAPTDSAAPSGDAADPAANAGEAGAADPTTAETAAPADAATAEPAAPADPTTAEPAAGADQAEADTAAPEADSMTADTPAADAAAPEATADTTMPEADTATSDASDAETPTPDASVEPSTTEAPVDAQPDAGAGDATAPVTPTEGPVENEVTQGTEPAPEVDATGSVAEAQQEGEALLENSAEDLSESPNSDVITGDTNDQNATTEPSAETAQDPAQVEMDANPTLTDDAAAPTESEAPTPRPNADTAATPEAPAAGQADATADTQAGTDGTDATASPAATATAPDATTSPDATAPDATTTADTAAPQDTATDTAATPSTEAPMTPEADSTAAVEQTDSERRALQGTEQSSVAAASEDAAPAEEIESQTVTDENSRSSAEDFATAIARELGNTQAAAPEQTAVENNDDDDDGLSTLQKALIAGAGAIAVGTLLNNNRRVVASSPDRVVVSGSDGGYEIIKDDTALLQRPGTQVSTERYDDGSTRTIVQREDGSQIVTIRDQDLRVLRRIRITPDGQQILLIDDTAPTQAVDLAQLAQPAVSSQGTYQPNMSQDALRDALAAQNGFDRSFSLAQVRNIAEVRQQVPAVNLDNITFASGSAAISPEQADELTDLGQFIRQTISDNPRELFLIEGHTDAVGDAAYNLALSDRRAESVALALTEYFEVPPENMVVQGYGERFLAVQTTEAERANRRATVRRITPLLQVASAQ